jgi:microcystin-dependent protein
VSTPFIAEIRMFAGNFAPRGWAFCQGQILSIAQNTALFSLVGTTYGGNGQTTFALPDFRGRVPVGTGQGPGLPPVNLGQLSGEAAHTLTINELPAHNHSATANGVAGAGTTTSPSGATWASSSTRDALYATAGSAAAMAPNAVTVGMAGGSQPHNIMQPYLGISVIIALEGIFPSRN